MTNNEIVETASFFLDKYGVKGLRTLDSIQLACAVSLKNSVDLFITSDNILLDIFNKEGLKGYDA